MIDLLPADSRILEEETIQHVKVTYYQDRDEAQNVYHYAFIHNGQAQSGMLRSDTRLEAIVLMRVICKEIINKLNDGSTSGK